MAEELEKKFIYILDEKEYYVHNKLIRIKLLDYLSPRLVMEIKIYRFLLIQIKN